MESITYLGQLRYSRDEQWVTVAEASTLRDAARAAAEAFASSADSSRRAWAVRVVAEAPQPVALRAGLCPG
jgi:hypothetical protein